MRLARRRRPGVPRPRRRPGQDPRLPGRARRDRGGSARPPGGARARWWRAPARGEATRSSSPTSSAEGARRAPTADELRALSAAAPARLHGARRLRRCWTRCRSPPTARSTARRCPPRTVRERADRRRRAPRRPRRSRSPRSGATCSASSGSASDDNFFAARRRLDPEHPGGRPGPPGRSADHHRGSSSSTRRSPALARGGGHRRRGRRRRPGAGDRGGAADADPALVLRERRRRAAGASTRRCCSTPRALAIRRRCAAALAALAAHHDALRLRFRRRTDAGGSSALRCSGAACELDVRDARRRGRGGARSSGRGEPRSRGSTWPAGRCSPPRLFDLRRGRRRPAARSSTTWWSTASPGACCWRTWRPPTGRPAPAGRRACRDAHDRVRSWAARLRAHPRGAARDERAHWLRRHRARATPLPVDAGRRNTAADGRGGRRSGWTARDTDALLRRSPASTAPRSTTCCSPRSAGRFAPGPAGRALLVDLRATAARSSSTTSTSRAPSAGSPPSSRSRLDVPDGGGGPREAILAVKEQLRAVPDRGLGYGVLRYLAGRRRRAPGRAAGARGQLQLPRPVRLGRRTTAAFAVPSPSGRGLERGGGRAAARTCWTSSRRCSPAAAASRAGTTASGRAPRATVAALADGIARRAARPDRPLLAPGRGRPHPVRLPAGPPGPGRASDRARRRRDRRQSRTSTR